MKRLILSLCLITVTLSPIKESTAMDFSKLADSFFESFDKSVFWKAIILIGFTLSCLPLVEKVAMFLKKPKEEPTLGTLYIAFDKKIKEGQEVLKKLEENLRVGNNDREKEKEKMGDSAIVSFGDLIEKYNELKLILDAKVERNDLEVFKGEMEKLFNRMFRKRMTYSDILSNPENEDEKNEDESMLPLGDNAEDFRMLMQALVNRDKEATQLLIHKLQAGDDQSVESPEKKKIRQLAKKPLSPSVPRAPQLEDASLGDEGRLSPTEGFTEIPLGSSPEQFQGFKVISKDN